MHYVSIVGVSMNSNVVVRDNLHSLLHLTTIGICIPRVISVSIGTEASDYLLPQIIPMEIHTHHNVYILMIHA